jgi:8-oxo-dGTP pyrophosphatase MutT (NUDIX family)
LESSEARRWRFVTVGGMVRMLTAEDGMRDRELEHLKTALGAAAGGYSVDAGGSGPWAAELNEAMARAARVAREGGGPRAAVAMVFSPEVDGPGLDVLMIKRAEKRGDPWSGHMAFPGGREDPEDRGLLATAVRETMEEVGLALEGAELLGALPALTSPTRAIGRRKALTIQPYVFAHHAPLPALTPELGEVASVHRFALRRLLADEGRATFPWEWKGQRFKMPCVLMDGCRIWGLSLRMLDDLMDRLRALD